MDTNHQPATIIDFWKENYTKNIGHAETFKNSEELIKIANIFSPGASYYYILNLKTLTIEYISPSVEKILGIPAEEVTMEKMLAKVQPEEFQKILKKEKVIQDFFFRFLPKNDILSYKIIFTYNRFDDCKQLKTMMVQTSIIALSEEILPKHIISIHTDISHLKVKSTNEVSFIHLDGEKSYYNISSHTGCFCPNNSIDEKKDWFETITKREKEIIQHLAKGESTKTIANLLHISAETVKTHRRNIALKSGASNTVELVSQCINAGMIV
ncbi:response regulator transcription factor [Mangrovimonas sp. TPBH4]|uniref:response regulator transcription factor n=1 Tax=Mangrovimonas sp. TPBH4 TaxID=1645914 RepID=UPI0006B4C2B7|nr:LuxR C-terminal-related transcriptional regulator [Mangrovimonas sp. TPBH4]